MARVVNQGVQRFSRAASGAWSRVLDTGRSLAVLPIRLGFGLIFFAHGAQKLFGLFGGGGIAGTADQFDAMGFRPGLLFALIAGLLEVVGGLFLAFGVITRLVAAALALEMLIVTLQVHWPNGFFMNWANKPGVGHGIEYPLALLVGLLAIVIYGAGAVSVDRQISHPHQPPRLVTDKPPGTPSGPSR